ncbi:DNA mismatch repair protein MutS, partial [Lachnospiraceae bacterium OttesenSCG-928-E19]|nr:DNA mismatch repair protein MutS [Lachnospiraceae bacterium OttesenSCG-928-E19]
DFYEVFFEDAKTASATLGLVLTKRGTDTNGDDIPMCGIPWHAADNYFGRLVRAGFKVALVEQMETPAQAKAAGRKFVDRRVVRVLTPGTLTDENLLSPKNSNFLVAVSENKNGGFDIAGCDISTGEFFIGDSASILDDMVRVNPAEIIYPESSAENTDVLRLRDTFKTTPVYEKLYNRADIGQIVSRVFGGSIDGAGVTSGNVVALLAGYLFNTQRDANIAFRAPYSFRAGHQLLIDSATWRSLEIDGAINDGGVCLIDILDKTRTSAGARRLRSYLRTLSSDMGEIRRRQEHIGHLILNRDVMGALSQILMRIPDVGRSLARLLSGRGTPRDLRYTADFMTMLPDMKSVGGRLDSDLAGKFANVNTHDMLAGELKFALADELPTFFRDGGVVRTGYDPALDNMRELSNGARETIAKLQAEYATSTGVNILKIKYNNILGYFIEVPSARADALMKPESGFIHRQTMAGNMRFTTSRLIDLDNEVRSAAERAAGIESEIVASFIEKIRNVSDDLLNTAELVADADVWLSLADVANEYEWVRPNVTDCCAFDVVGGRHPVIEHVLRNHGDKFVKNDCNLDTKTVALLTGPNMAGKSTYLRQNALIIVLAHLGSYVPATSAKIGVADQLFSRVGASDNLAAGQSTFMVEMVETANILNRATKKSFIIFDEIGRGTATYDGMAIAQAVLEYLDGLQPRSLFATHYHELTALVGDKPELLNDVQCLTIDVREHNNEIIFMHKIIPGVANRSYGIHVAKMAGIPKSVVERAEEVLESLEHKTPMPNRKPISTSEPSVVSTEEFVPTPDVKPSPVVIPGIADEPGVKSTVKEPRGPKTQLSLFG